MSEEETIIDHLERILFFNQRAGRELWFDKPKEVQDRDIENSERHLQEAIDYIRANQQKHGKDEDSGLPHLWHIITNAAFLCELDVDDSQEMVAPYIAAHSNINLAKEELETLKDLLTKQALDVGHLMTNIWERDKEE